MENSELLTKTVSEIIKEARFSFDTGDLNGFSEKIKEIKPVTQSVNSLLGKS